VLIDLEEDRRTALIVADVLKERPDRFRRTSRAGRCRVIIHEVKRSHALLAVAFALVLSACSSGPKVAVPKTVGMPFERAQAGILAAGLTVTYLNQVSTKYPDGTVIRTSPTASTTVSEATAVTVTVSRWPKVRVPSVTGMKWEQVQATFARARLTVVSEDVETDQASPGIAFGSFPPEGTVVQTGTLVKVKIAQPIVFAVPRTFGDSLTRAEETLSEAGLVASGPPIYVRTSAFPKGNGHPRESEARDSRPSTHDRDALRRMALTTSDWMGIATASAANRRAGSGAATLPVARPK
jgi:hypothetical protein